MPSSGCLNDASFGPSVRGCRGDFDFTLAFEQSILSALPAALFIVAAVLRMTCVARRAKVVRAVAFGSLKLAAIALYACSKLTFLILIAINPIDAADVFIASGVMQFVAALCMFALSHFDHERSARPSTLLSIYLFLTSLLDIAQTRTLWLSVGRGIETAIAAVFTMSLALKLSILVLEAQQKTKWVHWALPGLHSPEETSGMYSLGLFSWLNRLFFAGYRNTLRMQDLYPLDQAIRSEDLHSRFEIYTDFGKAESRRFGLVLKTVRTLWWQLLLPVFPRIALIGFKFCQPFLLNSVLAMLSNPASRTSANERYGLIGAAIFIYTGFAISNALYWYFHWRAIYMTRGVLVTAIYDKTTKIRHGSEGANGAVTLMGVDIERIIIGFMNLHEAWASAIEVPLASWLLYNELGVSAIAAVLVAVASAAVVYVLARLTGTAQKAWMAEVQRRVDLTAVMIAKMKNIKIAGLTGPVFEAIQDARIRELARSSRVRGLSISATVISFSAYTISPVLTFALSGRTLNSTKVYTALAFLMVMAPSLYNTLRCVPQLANALTCMGRIQSYLESEERRDCRVKSFGVAEEKDDSSFSHHDKSSMSSGSDFAAAVVVADGYFGWQEGQFALNDINLSLPRGGLTMIVGPVACGKSTLCHALLGEVPYHSGEVALHINSARVAYCEQSPFLANCTIRENIIGYSPFSAERYAEVVSATMLSIDFDTLPRGDQTLVGSNGIVLSGGQRQRVSMARALYLHTDMLVFDDVFSGLDADTEEQVFRHVFGTNGIVARRGATAVLCTHSVRHLPFADYIVVLTEKGFILEQGSFRSLQESSAFIRSLGLQTHEGEVAVDNLAPADETCKSEVICKVGSRDVDESQVESDTDTTGSAKTQVPHDRRTWPIYKYYIKSVGLSLALCQIGAAVLHGFLNNFPTVWLQYWTDDAFALHPQHTTAYYLGIYGMLNISCSLSLLLLGLLVYVVTVRKAGANLHHDALTTLIRAPLAYLTKTDQGLLTNLFSQDINLLDTELATALMNTLMDIAVGAGQAAILVAATPYIALGYPLLIILLWVIQRFYLRTSRQMRMLDLESKSPLYTHFLDTARGIVSLRANGFVPEDCIKHAAMLNNSQRPAYLLRMIQEWLALVLNLVVAGLATMLVSLALELRAGPGITGASLVTLVGLGETLSVLVQQWTKLETSMGAVKRLRDFNETVEPEDQPGEEVIPGLEWPANGKIDLRRVTASYHASEASDEKTDYAIHNMSLSILPGEKVALCGRTGSGKSSIIALLLKLLDPVPGSSSEVSIDGISLRTVNRAALRRRIIALPQEAVRLPEGSSYRQNLDPLNMAATDDDCRQVLELVNLLEVVESSGGLDAPIGSTSLSHGQQQLFALAQAILRQRLRSRHLEAAGNSATGGVLLLDEATSSVDRATEQLMQRLIRQEFGRWTIVAVSHRLEMVMDFDKAVIMDKGEVAEVGRPADLIKSDNSRFGKLWKASRGA